MTPAAIAGMTRSPQLRESPDTAKRHLSAEAEFAMKRSTRTLRSITPRIVAEDSTALISFLREVFDATGDIREGAPAQMAIGDSNILISEAGERAAFPAFLYVYVKDVDATYKKALRAGAVSVEEVWDTPYGDRRGMFSDRWKNVWQIAKRHA